jgi:hypothetical protein
VDPTWETNEISLASYIQYVTGYEPEFIWDSKYKTCTFSFPGTAGLKAEVVTYVGGDASVEPRQFFMCYVELRTAMLDSKTKRQKRSHR